MSQISTKSRQTGALVAAMLAAVLSGCASEPRSTYPILEQTLATDEKLDCLRLDDEILKANAIRDAIFEEHGDVIETALISSAIDLAIDPLSGVLGSIFTAGSTSRSVKTYIEAAAAAGLRMQQLLEYKQRDNCPSGPTALPELTDTLVLNSLRKLQSQLENEEVEGKNYISARRELLDNLR
jgi:hypothetical protein